VAADYPFVLAGKPARSADVLDVLNPYDGSATGRTWLAGDAEFDAAADAAVAAAPVMRRLPAYERGAILLRASAELAERKDESARTLAGEAGKPLKDALIEAERAAMTFQVAADEARRLGGEYVPMDLAPHGVDRMAIVKRVPVGPVAAISPFNFPLNLTSHKIAPAIAAGNPIVLKPATKKIILELGGNAAVIVDETADLEFAARRTAAAGFAFAGQSCFSGQRVYVHDDVFDAFAARLVQVVEALTVGDPLDPATDIVAHRPHA
jgi:acyl-CoA reductase-like NAD-dependent aldehyde dehydrogenase